MTLWKTSITSKLLEIGNSFFHTRRARLRGVFSSNKTIRSHLTVMTLWFWQVDMYTKNINRHLIHILDRSNRRQGVFANNLMNISLYIVMNLLMN